MVQRVRSRFQRPQSWAGITAIFLVSITGYAADVLELRVGYWEFVAEVPGQSTPQRSFQCLTPVELENMRFFIANEEECTTLPGGTQSKTQYEIDQTCQYETDAITIHYRLEARDPMYVTTTISMTHDGQYFESRGIARWLQESCDAASIPIS